MSNYGSMPPTGPYNLPTQGNPAQQQPSYQTGAPSQGHQGHGHKSGGAFGQMMNQAVTTGKPMLNKLGKTISSKLGGKPAAGPPQHLQSYQNYQEHNQPQGYQQQQQGQTYSPQPQQRPWQPPSQQPQQSQQPQAPNTSNAFTPSQQSPYQQSSNYATPASGHSGQNNYFPAQNAQPPNAPPPNASFTQSGVTGSNQHSPALQGQYGQQGQQGQQGQHGQLHGQPQPDQQWQGGYGGQISPQQTGIIGTTPNAVHTQPSQAPHMGGVSPEIPPNKPVAAQPSWRHSPRPEQSQLQNQGFQPPQHPLLDAAVSQQPPHSPVAPQHQFQPVSSPPVNHDQAQQQQWNSMSPISPQSHAPIPPTSVSPPPQQQMHAPPQAQPNMPSLPSQPPTPGVQHPAPQPSAPTEFIAELPADMSELHISKSQGNSPTAQALQYQAYQPPGAQVGSPQNRFSVPRRAMSMSSIPLADPWRFADPVTEQPTREFYILADLIFDALDRKYEPQNTGMLEAPKVLKSWIDLSEEAHRIFSFDNYGAVASMWSLEGVPHVMVPIQPSLTPLWNFSQHSHADDIKIISHPPSANSTYATYMPALNRAGWYKFFFLEAVHGPDVVCRLLPALCADTYKPGVLNHPDLNRRDRSDIPALQARAAEISTVAIKRVCDDAKAAMNAASQLRARTQQIPNSQVPYPHGAAEDEAMRMYNIQRQANNAAVNAVSNDRFTYGPGSGQTSGHV